jgi:predicted nucleic acid-binding protein
MAHVIDTDVLIDVTKGNTAAITFLESLPDCAISTITAMELYCWCNDAATN